jgi:hypothetical protein
MTYTINNHKYELLSVSTEDYNILIYREQRLLPFVGMRQPAPVGSTLGISVVMSVMFRGQPARHHIFRIFKDNELIDSGELDGYGQFSGVKIKTDQVCECVPIDLNNSSSKCLKSVELYHLELDPPEASSLASRERHS